MEWLSWKQKVTHCYEECCLEINLGKRNLLDTHVLALVSAFLWEVQKEKRGKENFAIFFF
jgi:hypothetical protein